MLKKTAFLLSLLAVIAVKLNKKGRHLPLIGEKAPSFKANTTQGEINFPEDYKGSWVILFSHPADFTPVCTSEFIVFQSMKEELEQINTELVGISVDSINAHNAWIKAIEEKIEFNGMKNVKITFPLIDDVKGRVANLYGMIQPTADDTRTVRAVFVIDPRGIIRALVYYPLTNGRNLQEIKRLLIAMQTSDEFGIATPANWKAGDDVILPPPTTAEAIQERLSEEGENVRCDEWFMCFKKLPEEQIKKKIVFNYLCNNDE